jgi:hypothetical protein
MKVIGFTFIRNAIKYDYPIVEAICSILPLCDEIIVAVGKSEDETLALIRKINPDKIRILETVWDDSIRSGGRVLAIETDKAFQAIDTTSDWCIYIQGDEVIHEKYHSEIHRAMQQYSKRDDVDGLLFGYKHFYGSYDYVGTASRWYKNEIRVVKNDKSIYSYKDAQGFRKGDDKKLNVIPIDAFIYHYGWVKDPRSMQLKQEDFNKLWHDDKWIQQNVRQADEFDYSKDVSALELFREVHPKVMIERIKTKNWTFEHDISFSKFSVKDRFKRFLYRTLNIDLNYKNYKIVNK